MSHNLWDVAAAYAREAFEGARSGEEAAAAYEAALAADPFGQYPAAEKASRLSS